jgi:hypothetical protein
VAVGSPPEAEAAVAVGSPPEAEGSPPGAEVGIRQEVGVDSRQEVGVVDRSSGLPQIVGVSIGKQIVVMILSAIVCLFSSHNGNRTAMSQRMPQPDATQ